MKNLFCLFFLIFGRTLVFFAQPFTMDTIVFKTKEPIISATYYNGSFYALDKKSKLLKFNLDNTSETVSTSNIEFEYISNVQGILIGYEHFSKSHKYNTHREYHYNGNQFKKKGRVKEGYVFLLEDIDYQIFSTCSGEWGGTIYFKDKRTKKIYKVSTVCPLVVNRIKSNYFITTGLCHGMCSSEIIRIDNPQLLESYVKKNLKNISNIESLSTKSCVLLADTTHLEVITSFVFGNELYHIMTEHPLEFNSYKYTTSIYKIENNCFEKIMPLFECELGRAPYALEVMWNNGFILTTNLDEQNKVCLLGIEGLHLTAYIFENEN